MMRMTAASTSGSGAVLITSLASTTQNRGLNVASTVFGHPLMLAWYFWLSDGYPATIVEAWPSGTATFTQEDVRTPDCWGR
jgi:hypothetical protein